MITDSNDIPITYLNFSQVESSDGPVFVVKVPCVVGHVLKADPNDDVEVFARPSGVGSYVDIALTPISLDPYAGTSQAFQLFLRTGAVSGLVSTAVGLTAGNP